MEKRQCLLAGFQRCRCVLQHFESDNKIEDPRRWPRGAIVHRVPEDSIEAFLGKYACQGSISDAVIEYALRIDFGNEIEQHLCVRPIPGPARVGIDIG